MEEGLEVTGERVTESEEHERGERYVLTVQQITASVDLHPLAFEELSPGRPETLDVPYPVSGVEGGLGVSADPPGTGHKRGPTGLVVTRPPVGGT